MLVAGIDEAGRGSLLGPLVIACIIINDDKIKYLKEIGVKDSKMLSRKKRLELYEEIKEVADKMIIKKITTKAIDARTNLNRLELDTIANILKNVRLEEIYIDSFYRNPKKIVEVLANRLCYNPKIYAEHRADANNIVVGAASIIAKVNRDKEIDKLRVYGNVGSGYPSDEITIKFVEEWIKKNKQYPEFVRKSWKTMKRIDISQSQLHDPYQKVLD
ncbi:MAG: ribonuclease HII [Candidatus Nitrosocaldaceae archaeon]|nr:MAG: ribonuclease HII [Candidatus Nitrosocaldaceae archaeon]